MPQVQGLIEFELFIHFSRSFTIFIYSQRRIHLNYIIAVIRVFLFRKIVYACFCNYEHIF